MYPREEHTGETGKNICALGSCLFTTTTKGRRNRGGKGGWIISPTDMLPQISIRRAYYAHHLTTRQLLGFSEPSYGPATSCKD